MIRVANSPSTRFLRQAELKSINQGLEYVEVEYEGGLSYKGYRSEDRNREGVGILIFPIGDKYTGERHLGKLHGSA